MGCVSGSLLALPAGRRRHPSPLDPQGSAWRHMLRSGAPGGRSRLTTTYSGWLSPETRDAVSLQHCSYAFVNQIHASSMQVTGRSRLFARKRPARHPPTTLVPREPLASAPHGQGRRRRCGYDRRACPRRRRVGPGRRRRLPRADPALPPPRLGRARPGRDLGGRAGHPGRGRRPPGGGRPHRRRHRHHQPARDPGGLRPLDRPAAAPGDRLAGPPHRRAVRRAGRRRSPAAGAGQDGPRPRPVLQRHQGGLAVALRRAAARPLRPEPLLLHGRHLGPVEPHRRHGRRRLRHRPLQRQPYPPARYRHPRLVGRAVRTLRPAGAHPARGAAVGRALRHRRAGGSRARVGGPRRRPRLRRAGRPAGRALRAGLLRPRDGQGHLRHGELRARQCRARAPIGSRRPHGQLRLGPRRARTDLPRPRRLRARGLGLRVGRGNPMAARRTRRRSTPPPRSGPWRRRSPTAAVSPSYPRSPVSAARGGIPRLAASSPASPAAQDAPRSRGPAWRPWRSRCGT